MEDTIDEGVAGDGAFGDDVAVKRGVGVKDCVGEDGVEVYETFVGG